MPIHIQALGPVLPIRVTVKKSLYLAIVFVIMISVAGCAGVKVKNISPSEQINQRRGDILTSGKLSAASQEVLRVIGYDSALCEKNPDECRQALSISNGLTEEQRQSALAEIWLQSGLKKQKQHSGKTNPEDIPVEEWLEAARHAYAYLFFTERTSSQRAFEDRQMQVRDYYNYAVQQAVTEMYHTYDPNNHTLPARQSGYFDNWKINLDLSTAQLINNTLPEKLMPAQTLSFSGLRNIYRRDGFGADLIAVMPQSDNHNKQPDDQAQPFLKPPFLPLTVLIYFQGNTLSEVINSRQIKVSLFDPYLVSSVSIAQQQVPLSANFSSSYGLWLARSGFATAAFKNLFGRQGALTYPKIYLMQPYDPNRRIVVLLHGIASSPEAWINLTNEIMGDEQLRQNYQIWLVYYPTNAPLALNHANIRDVLDKTLKNFDPEDKYKASKQITLVGHSMGGVLSRLMVSTSTESTWEPFVQKELPLWSRQQGAVQDKLKQKYLNFEPVAQVSDVIFIATPHKGSPVAGKKMIRWMSKMITLPHAMFKQITDNTYDMGQTPLGIPNSIDNLNDSNVFMQLVSALPINPNIRYHSIIGNFTPKRPLSESTDGIVPYSSAHLDGACSELVVESFHSVQEEPKAILEIRRILKEQLGGKVYCEQMEL